jgi:hypothetical protein
LHRHRGILGIGVFLFFVLRQTQRTQYQILKTLTLFCQALFPVSLATPWPSNRNLATKTRPSHRCDLTALWGPTCTSIAGTQSNCQHSYGIPGTFRTIPSSEWTHCGHSYTFVFCQKYPCGC